MGHKNKKSLTLQVKEQLEQKLKIGCSKYIDKHNGIANDYIYSYSTYRTYMKEANYFVKWCKETHNCKTLDECASYIKEWIDSRRCLSAYTLKLDVAALRKLYGLSASELAIKTPPRTRDKITRSRGPKIRDKHFSENRNADLVKFCRSTGLRRNELSHLTGTMLVSDDRGKICINVTIGAKGGRPRLAPIIGDVDKIVSIMKAAGNNKVFPHISSAADIHSYRADYATAIYMMYARPISKIPYDKINRGSGHRYQSDVYHAKDGRKLDKMAMLEASKALGHNRISVVGEHYLKIK